MRAYFSVISLLLLLISCSGKAPTKANFSFNISGLPLTSVQGGLVVFGRSTSGDKFVRVIQTSSGTGSMREELPKGTWTFGAVAWAGDKGFKGTITCGFNPGTNLSEDAVAVNLSLTNARCFDSDVAEPGSFTGTPPTRRFVQTYISPCEGSVASRSTTSCGYSPTLRPIERGFLGSYKIYLPGSRTFGGATSAIAGEELESLCFSTENDSEPVPSPTYTTGNSLNLPAFLPSVGFPLQIIGFMGSACETTNGHITRNLSDVNQAKIVNISPGVLNLLHVSASAADLCAISDSLNIVSQPASGNGTLNAPWLICSERQLVAIQQNFSSSFGTTLVNEGVYVLGRDMDLIEFIQGGALSAQAEPCLKPGDTFAPIGKTFSAPPACAISDLSVSGNFHFDGNNKTIKNFRFRYSDDEIGFFSRIQGHVYDVNFDRADVEGDNYTGIAVGVQFGGTLKMIKVTNSRVEGDDKTGGVLGQGNGGLNPYELHANSVEVRGDNETGGLVGAQTTGNITDASFSGTVYSGSNTVKSGGIVGSSTGNLTNVVSSGILSGRTTYMGGIAGYGGLIMYARSDMYIKDHNSSPSGARELGGIAGNASTISRSFFTGSIHTSCASGCNKGALAGNAATIPYAYSHASYAEGAGVDGSTAYALDDMRTAAFLTDINTADGPPIVWTQASSDFPRLPFEAGRPCTTATDNDSVPNQISTHLRGDATNPITICHSVQLSNISLTPANSHVHLKQNVNMNSLNVGGTFNGHFNGNRNIIHSFTSVSDGANSSFVDIISATSSFKNVILAGFKITESPGCSTCKEASLANVNFGQVSEIFVTDLKIEAANSGTEVAGLIHENASSGTVSGIEVHGDLKNDSRIGGVVYHNKGTLKDNVSEVKIDLNGSNTANYVGGIAAINESDVYYNRFRGEIFNMGSGGTHMGGIVGFLTYTGTVPKVIDNEFTERANMHFYTGVVNSGGIVGYSDTSSNIVARNISEGFINNQGSEASVHPIVGGGTFTETISGVLSPNYYIHPDFIMLANSFDLPLSTSIVSADTCDLIVDTGTSDSTVTHGALYIINEGYFMGPMVEAASVYTITVKLDNSRCTSLNGTPTGNMIIYREFSSPVAVTPTILKSNNYDLVDMTVTADKVRAFSAYKSFIQGLIPSSPPVWISDEEGIGLFRPGH